MFIWHRGFNSSHLVRKNCETFFGNLIETSLHSSIMDEIERALNENEI